MIELTAKDKEALALLYERPEFKVFKKWSELKRAECAERLLNVPMNEPGSSERVAMLQGQALSHSLALLELKKIHKDQTKKNEG